MEGNEEMSQIHSQSIGNDPMDHKVFPPLITIELRGCGLNKFMES